MKARTLKECLKEKLGEGEWPRSFVVVGNIAIINLKENMLKYSRQIAECIMESQKRVRAVYAKILTEGAYRIAKLIHIGGAKETETIFKQAGCRFKVDVTKMYVNPSLETEYLRIAELVKDGERILDLFCGGGFFLIHAACRKKIMGIGIDINPIALKYARYNVKINKLKGIVEFLNADSKYAERLLKMKFDRIIMNLPHKSEEYLPVARMLVNSDGYIHLYKLLAEDEVVIFKEWIEGQGFRVIRFRKVLDYAPRKAIFVFDLRISSTNASSSGFNT